MEEHEVIAHTALHLLKKGARITKVSVREKKHDDHIRNFLLKNKIERNAINKIEFKRREEDIVADLRFGGKKKQKQLEVEAKGGEVYYGIYTSLGQFLCLKKSPSTFYWFGFAFPFSWREPVRKALRSNDTVKPVISDIIRKYTKNGQGLWFYFVKDDGSVLQETWKKTLGR